MNKIKTQYLILILLSFVWNSFLAYIDPPQVDTTYIIQDFDGDSFIDTLICVKVYYSYTISYIDGKTNQSFEFDHDWNRASFKSYVAFDSSLIDNQTLIDTVLARYALGSSQRTHPCLAWQENVYQNINKEGEHFKLVSKPDIQWSDTQLPFPLRTWRFLNRDWENNNGLFIEIYSNGAHFDWSPEALAVDYINKETEFGKVYSSRQGLFIEQGDSFRTLFISNGCLPGPSKLRWKSIDTFFIYRDIIILDQAAPLFGNNNLVFIDISSGTIAFVKEEFLVQDYPLTFCFDLEVEGSKALIKPYKCGESGEEYPELTDVMFDLENWYSLFKTEVNRQ
ncbi:hypothetical protein GYB22_01195 [bacterium]|nr:hypothetical protein [bacterium]